MKTLKMEELYENKTKYTRKEYDDFIKVHQQEYATSENAFTIFNILFFGMCMVFAFIEKEWILAIAILLGLLIYIWYKFIRPVKRAEKDINSEKLSGNFINTYKFYKSYFNVENPEGKAQIFYFKLYRVIETKDMYYIYISRDNAFILSKDSFTKGDKLEFAKFIKSKVRMKYRNRIKRS